MLTTWKKFLGLVVLVPLLVFATILEERGRLNTSKWPLNSEFYQEWHFP